MKLIIDIPEEDYNFVKKQVTDGITNPLKIRIANGTPLPKGHGDLIDANKLPYEDIECTDGNTYMVVNAYDVDNAPIIIEADAESEGE